MTVLEKVKKGAWIVAIAAPTLMTLIRENLHSARLMSLVLTVQQQNNPKRRCYNNNNLMTLVLLKSTEITQIINKNKHYALVAW